MKVAICEYCGKPGDYPVCRPHSKPSKAELLFASEKRVKELEAALIDLCNAVERPEQYDLTAVMQRALPLSEALNEP